jgi:hypothetical protein
MQIDLCEVILAWFTYEDVRFDAPLPQFKLLWFNASLQE